MDPMGCIFKLVGADTDSECKVNDKTDAQRIFSQACYTLQFLRHAYSPFYYIIWTQ